MSFLFPISIPTATSLSFIKWRLWAFMFCFMSSMKISALLPVLFLFMSAGLQSQQSSDGQLIAEKLNEMQKVVYSTSPAKALPKLKELVGMSEKAGYTEGVSKAGYLLAIAYFNSSDYHKVVNLDTKYQDAAQQSADYESLSHIYRLRGCAYAELGLQNKGESEIRRAQQYAAKIPSESKKQYALSLIYSNQANHLMKQKAPQKEILDLLRRSISASEKIDEAGSQEQARKHSMISYSYIIMARLFEEADDLKAAEEYYLKALKIHETETVPLVEKVVLLNQLSYYYFEQGDFLKTIQFAEKGLLTEKKAKVPQLRKDLYEILSKSYVETQQIEESKDYLRLFTALNDSLSSVNKFAVSAALDRNVSQQKELQMNNLNKQLVIYVLSALLLVIFGVFIFFQKRRQKQIRKLRKILDQIKANQENPSPAILRFDNVVSKPPVEKRTSPMSAEAEAKLLEKLQEFEQSDLYLKKGVSLPFVAAELETNTKYLSYLIKNHKEKDFSEYINDLKINYIIRKITEEPIYRQYKINTLAEEAGFSSHSKFATVFKAAVGVTPSVFCKAIKDTAPGEN